MLLGFHQRDALTPSTASSGSFLLRATSPQPLSVRTCSRLRVTYWLTRSATAFLFLYESAGLSLEMIDTVYNDPNVKPWHSVSWAPPGYDSRADYRRAIGKAEAEAKVEHREFASDSASENGTAIGDRLSTEKPMTKMMA